MTLRGCAKKKKKKERELDHKTLFSFPSLLSLSLSLVSPSASHFLKRKFLKRYLSKQIDTLAYYLLSFPR